MYECSNDHIKIAWEMNISCPLCYILSKRLSNTAVFEYDRDKNYYKLKIEKAGYKNDFLRLSLWDSFGYTLKEHYIKLSTLFDNLKNE